MPTPIRSKLSGTTTSADFCCPVPSHYCDGSQTNLAEKQISRDKRSFFRAAPAESTQRSLGKHGFHRSMPAHPPLYALYSVSVRQVVAVAKTSFRPHLAVTPLSSLNGPVFLGRRGLTPPRTGTCPAYIRRPSFGLKEGRCDFGQKNVYCWLDSGSDVRTVPSPAGGIERFCDTAGVSLEVGCWAVAAGCEFSSG
jgi:hypothetical protein